MEEKTRLNSYRDLIVWQKSTKLVIEIYKTTINFPKTEIFGLTSQIKRAVVSIPSNIAEGRNRASTKEFVQFLRISYGSGAELETQLYIAKELRFLTELDYNRIVDMLSEIMKMLNAMIFKLKANTLKATT